MPRVSSNEYKYVDEDGQAQRFKAVFEVNGSGFFFVNIPDWLQSNAEAIARNFDCWVCRPKIHLRIESKQLIDVQNAISVALREYSKPEVTRELRTGAEAPWQPA